MKFLSFSIKEKIMVKSICVAILIAWTATAIFATATMSESWVLVPLAGFNFLFHEAGHLLVDIFTSDELVRALSGTIAEVLVVTGIIYIILRSKERIAYVFSGAWIVVTLGGIAKYMADAEVLELELYSINPGSLTDVKLLHDWEIIFGRMGVIGNAFLIASFVASVGLLVGVLIWYRGVKKYWMLNIKDRKLEETN